MDKELLLERIRTLTHPLEPISVTHTLKLEPVEGVRCVAFDFYGTMFISAVGDIGVDEEKQESSYRHFIEALKKSGFAVENPSAGKKGVTVFEKIADAHIRAARRKGIDHPEPDMVSVWTDVLTELAEGGDISGEVSRDNVLRFGIEFEFRINDIWPVPGVKTLLNRLLDLNLELGIISNSQYYTPLAFEALLNRSPEAFGFNPGLLVWSYATGRKKPSVEFYRLFEKAAEKEGIQPHEVLYVGNDLEKDIEPAQKIGLRTALFVGDRRSIRHIPEKFEIQQIQPDLVVNSLSQIAECLEF